MIRDIAARRLVLACLAFSSVFVGACDHGEHAWEPLTEQKVYVSDKFYDVAPRGDKEAIIVGYEGKILRTKDFGITWEQIDSGTDSSLYSIDFSSDKVGWIVGQAGTILKTTDGGSTWEKLPAEIYMGSDCQNDPQYRADKPEECPLAYLFSVSAIDDNTAAAIGDRSVYTITHDGGKTWSTKTVTTAASEAEAGDEFALVYKDPVLYDIQFLDSQTGFIVGEFGKIYKTTDGGNVWSEKQSSLMGKDIFDVLDLPTLFDVTFADSQNGIAAGLDGRIAVTHDAGETWNFEPNNVEEYTDPFYAGVILPNGTRWVVGSSGQVVMSPPGAPFQRGDLGSAINSWIRAVSFLNNQRGWIVGGFGLIMNTDDGGKSWIRRIG